MGKKVLVEYKVHYIDSIRVVFFFTWAGLVRGCSLFRIMSYDARPLAHSSAGRTFDSAAVTSLLSGMGVGPCDTTRLKRCEAWLRVRAGETGGSGVDGV